jgi:hypothetical protein
MEFQLSVPAQDVSLSFLAGENQTKPWATIFISSREDNCDLYPNPHFQKMAGVENHEDWSGSLSIQSLDERKEHWFSGVVAKKYLPWNSQEPYATVEIEKMLGGANIDANIWLPPDVFGATWKSCEIASTSPDRILRFNVIVIDRNEEAEDDLEHKERSYFKGLSNFQFHTGRLRDRDKIEK